MAKNDDGMDPLRKGKEFVYEQWRKILCIFVIGEDISNNRFTPENVTAEKVRTIFDNGYKLALLQTKISLQKELSVTVDPINVMMLKRFIHQVDDRLESSNCFVSFQQSGDPTLYLDAVKRESEFRRYAQDDVTKWINNQM